MNIKGAVLILAALFAAASAQAAEKFGTDVHTARGMTFEMCHGKGNPAELDPPDIKKCTQCHATVTLVAKTKNVKPQNPHVSPHYQDQLECTNCHHMHEESENFCGQCYDFKFQVP